jgi:epoxyqueuosine reductase
MNLKSSIKKFSLDLGIDTIGFCKMRRFDELRSFFEERKTKGLENEFEETDIEKRIDSFQYMGDGKTIISIAFPYIHEFEKAEEVYFSKYTFGKDYHLVVSEYLKKICSFIEGLGGKAIYFVDSNPLPERYIAYLCGIGFIGKNNMVITEKYGSYVFLGEIITDLEIEPDIPKQQQCGECSICLKKCPTKSINRAGSCPNICLSYITQKKQIEELWFEKLEGRIFGCDSCQTECPHNLKAKFSNLVEFSPFEFMKDISLEELIQIDNKIFKDKYAKTSCGWRGKNVLQRNALINYTMMKNKLDIDINKIKSPYILDYYNRLLKALQL